MSNSGQKTYQLYSFKPFRFEKITPNPDSKIPSPRSGHRIGADSSNLYLFGGYNPSPHGSQDNDYWINSLFQELWKFNFAAKEWTKLPNSHTLPNELVSSALIILNDILLVYGGTSFPFGTSSSNHLYVYKVCDDSGVMLKVPTTGQQPSPMYGQALAYHNGYLYTIGGTTGHTFTCDIHRLNIHTKIWENFYLCNGIGDYEPKGRYRHEVGFDGRYIYLLGGGTPFEVYGFRFIPTFDIEKRLWFKLKTCKDKRQGYPPARRCHGAAQISTGKRFQIFITGGFDGDRIFNDLWRLDIPTYKWTFFSWSLLPEQIYFHATAVTPEGRLYVFGGNCSLEDNNRSNRIYSTWLYIPKLSEICWEAVLHYSSYIRKCKTEDLLKVGLPRQFVKRLGSGRMDC